MINLELLLFVLFQEKSTPDTGCVWDKLRTCRTNSLVSQLRIEKVAHFNTAKVTIEKVRNLQNRVNSAHCCDSMILPFH